MSQEQARQFLTQGIELARQGQKDQARQLFQNAIKLDPQNEAAWLWMSSVARDNRERLFCLQNVLQINPQNERALQGLQALGVDPRQVLAQGQQSGGQTAGAPAAGAGAAPSAPSQIPALNRERLQAILPKVDEFMRGYRSVPVAGDLDWGAKSGLKYGEALALRKRTVRYAMLGGTIAAVLLLILIGGAVLLNSFGGDVIAQATIPSSPTATNTPTNTPTATPGVTSTPFPEGTNFPTPVTPSAQLVAGNRAVAFPSPTPPHVGLSAQDARFVGAVELLSQGQFEIALPTISAERASSLSCNPTAYYYEIIGLVEQGGRSNLNQAETLVTEALARTDGTCRNSEILLTASCYVQYEQGRTTNDLEARQRRYGAAGPDCQAALNDASRNPPLAALVLARLNMAGLQADGQNPNIAAARSVLDATLRDAPNDITLLLERARVEIVAENYQDALRYVAEALYVNPLSEEAFGLRVEAFLALADAKDGTNSPLDRAEKTRLYGLAVNAAQGYLLEYNGAPQAYVLLARARYGEGNADLALEAINRVIAVGNELPPELQSSVQAAYALRADIYNDQGKYADALEDIKTLLIDAPNDPVLVERQLNSSLRVKDYRQAQENLNTLLQNSPQRVDLQLLRAQFLTETCQTVEAIRCDFDDALDILTDDFIAGLDAEQALLARAYRAKARYEMTRSERAAERISSAQAETAYREILSEIESILERNERPIDQYYRGLLLEALNRQDQALLAYDWVMYWARFYDYPFQTAVEARILDLRGAPEEPEPEEDENEEDSEEAEEET